MPSEENARRLDNALNTGNVLSSFLPQEEAAVAGYFETARQLEQQAVMIREFALSFVPGILQTKRYARAVLSRSFPPVSDEECDRLVVTRLERAKILDDPMTPVVWALLDEAVCDARSADPVSWRNSSTTSYVLPTSAGSRCTCCRSPWAATHY